MKLKEFFYLLGLKPRALRYGSVVRTVVLPEDGEVQFAHWLHPRSYSAAPNPQYLANLRRYLRPGDVAIDIGANVGDSTLPLALAVGSSGAVLALEPNPFVFPTLELLASLNPDRTSIIPLPIAATRDDGPTVMHFSERGYCNGAINEGVSRWVHGGAYQLSVEGRRFPALLEREYPDLLPRLRFIKVDAEGHDLAILESMEDLLRKLRPVLQVEFFNERKAQPGYRRRLLEFLRGLGYSVRRVQENSAQFLADPIDLEILHEHKMFDAFCQPERVDTDPLSPAAS